MTPYYENPHFLISRTSVTYQKAHERLCHLAATILEKRGFNVEFEKVIEQYRIDVYGERNGEILIYECGDCIQEKLDWLRKHIGKTIHLPYLDQWVKKSTWCTNEEFWDAYMRWRPPDGRETLRMASRVR